MITIVYSTHKDSEYNNKFRQHLLQTVGFKDVQILEYVNHNDIKLEKDWGKNSFLDYLFNLIDNPTQ